MFATAQPSSSTDGWRPVRCPILRAPTRRRSRSIRLARLRSACRQHQPRRGLQSRSRGEKSDAAAVLIAELRLVFEISHRGASASSATWSRAARRPASLTQQLSAASIQPAVVPAVETRPGAEQVDGLCWFGRLSDLRPPLVQKTGRQGLITAPSSRLHRLHFHPLDGFHCDIVWRQRMTSEEDGEEVRRGQLAVEHPHSVVEVFGAVQMKSTRPRGWLSGKPALDAITPAMLLPPSAMPIATRAPPDRPVRYSRCGSTEKRRLTSLIIACAAAFEMATGPFRELFDAATTTPYCSAAARYFSTITRPRAAGSKASSTVQRRADE